MQEIFLYQSPEWLLPTSESLHITGVPYFWWKMFGCPNFALFGQSASEIIPVLHLSFFRKVVAFGPCELEFCPVPVLAWKLESIVRNRSTPASSGGYAGFELSLEHCSREVFCHVLLHAGRRWWSKESCEIRTFAELLVLNPVVSAELVSGSCLSERRRILEGCCFPHEHSLLQGFPHLQLCSRCTTVGIASLGKCSICKEQLMSSACLT